MLTSEVYVCTLAAPAPEPGAGVESQALWPERGAARVRAASPSTDVLPSLARTGPEGVPCHWPRWSPDGKQLSLLAGVPGSEQLWLTADDDGTGAQPLTAGPGVIESSWASDGRRIVYSVAGPRHQLWTVNTDSAEPCCIGDGAFDDSAPAWSPDGRTIAFLSRRDSPFADIWLMAPEGGTTRRVTHGLGPIRALAWSPDSRRIAYIGKRRGHAQGVNFGLFVCAADGQQTLELRAQLDRSLGLVVRSDDVRGMEPPSLAWSPDGQRIYFAYADGGVSHIAWAALDGSSGIAVDGQRACLSFSVAAGADRIAFVAADALSPGEIYTAGGDGRDERRVTGCNDSWLREVVLSRPERIMFPTDDGQAVEGWLLRPPGWSPAQRYPLILEVHGGPHYPLGERFYFDFQRLAALGYIVLYCNARGSQGYGEQFATSIRGAWGERDCRDLMLALDVALGLPEVDSARLAVTGVSYGGYMTNWLVGHSDRFRAAICENGISNLTTNFATSLHGGEFWEWELCGTPLTQPERYRALSPITFADRMRTPLLLIHAEQDTNCAIAQSEELEARLRALDRTVSLVRIPDEGHLMNLLGRPSARLTRMAAIDEWLKRWL